MSEPRDLEADIETLIVAVKEIDQNGLDADESAIRDAAEVVGTVLEHGKTAELLGEADYDGDIEDLESLVGNLTSIADGGAVEDDVDEVMAELSQFFLSYLYVTADKFMGE